MHFVLRLELLVLGGEMHRVLHGLQQESLVAALHGPPLLLAHLVEHLKHLGRGRKMAPPPENKARNSFILVRIFTLSMH